MIAHSRRTHASRSRLRAGLATAVSASLALAVSLPATQAFAAPGTTGSVSDPASYVNPFIGTANAGNTYPGAVAPFGMLSWSPDQMHYSGATSGSHAGKGVMRSTSPSGYQYNSHDTRGFGLAHVSGAGCAGLSGDVPLMPVTGDVTTSPLTEDADNSSKYTSTFDPANESASPGSYSVQLDNGIDVDLAATTRAGAGTFSYPSGEDATMLIRSSDSLMGSEDADVTIDPNNQTVSGSVTSGNFCGSFVGDGSLIRSYYTLHYVITFDKDFQAYGTYEDDTVEDSSKTASGGTGYTGGVDGNGSSQNGFPPAGKGSGAFVTFDTSNDSTVHARVAISYVSLDGAEQNLAAEVPAGTTYEDVASATHDAWNTELSRIEIADTATTNQRTVFYSAMYHALLHPNIFSDVDDKYWGFDQQEHTLPSGQDAQYATFSGWDVYRSQVQLITLLDPKRGSDIAHSLLNQADQNDGVWDRWTHNSGATHVMVGDPSDIALAGIVSFGGDDFPVEDAYDSLKQAATVPTPEDGSREGWNIGVIGQRPSLADYLEKGYYPEGCNAWGCPDETLEISAADYGIATLAQYLGKTADYTEFATRSQNWQNQFNPDATDENGFHGYFQQREADGSWKGGFNYSEGDGFVEGTAAAYAWLVQHNPAGLFSAMGGRDVAIQRLDKHMKDDQGNYVLTGSWSNNTHVNLDNEPGVAVPWLYNYAGAPYKTQDAIRATIQQLWLDPTANNPANGIPGNDDLGEMSSWLVFAAMGLFPENPSRAELTVAAPLFDTVVLHRANGKTLTINAPDAGSKHFIDSMKVDGNSTTKTYLPADAIAKDTTVDYTLSSEANTTWGTDPSDAPPSDRTGERLYLASASPESVAGVAGRQTQDITVSAVGASESGDDVHYTVDTPSGLTAVDPTGTLSESDVPGHLSGSFRIAVDDGVADGTYPVTVTLTSAGSTVGEVSVDVNVADQTTALFSSSIESGQPQPKTDTQIDSNNWGEYCCGIGGLETSSHSEKAHTGGHSVIYSGQALGEDASASNVVFTDESGFSKPVADGESFSYWVYPQETGGPFSNQIQDASKYAALDLVFTDGTKLSDNDIDPVTSNGAKIDALSQGSELTTDSWNHVTVKLPSSVVGKTIKTIALSMNTGDNFDGSDGDAGYARGWFDDIALLMPAQPITASAHTGLTARVDRSVSLNLADVTGGNATDADDYTATIDWGDGSPSESGTVTEDGDHAVISGTHTYGSTGTENPTVTVSDLDGVTTTAEVEVEVQTEDTLPYTTSADPDTLTLASGQRSDAITLAAVPTSGSSEGPVTFTVDAPAAIGVSTTEGTLKDNGSGTLSKKLTLRPKIGTTDGSYDVKVSFKDGATSLDTVTITVTIDTTAVLDFSTGFENGEPDLAGASLSETTSANFTGFCCSLTGAESKTQDASSDATANSHSGDMTMVYSGRAVGPDATASNVMFQNVPQLSAPLAAGTSLSYWVYPQNSDGPTVGGDTFDQNASQFVALDLLFTDGTRLSDPDIDPMASNGAKIDPLSQGGVLNHDAWNHVTVTLPSSVVGKTIKKVLIAFDTGQTYGSSSDDTGYLRGWVDDIAIQGQGAGIAPVTVDPETGVTATRDVRLNATLGHVTGGQGTDAEDYTATIDWGDGSATDDATLKDDDDGVAVQGTHTYTDDGSYTVTIVSRDMTNRESDPVTLTINVTAPKPVVLEAMPQLTVVTGKAFVGSVAKFEPRAQDKAGDFTATIDWGDDTGTRNALVTGGSPDFTVDALHSYAEAGDYEATVTVTDTEDNTSTVSVPVKAVGSSTGPGGGEEQVTAAMTTDLAAASTVFGTKNHVDVDVTAGDDPAAGIVTITDGARTVDAQVLNKGVATLQLGRELAAGTHHLTVTYESIAGSGVLPPASQQVTVTVTKAQLKKFKVKGKKKTKKHHKSWVKVKVSKNLTNEQVAKGKVWIKVKKHGSFTNYKKRSMKKFRTANGKLKIKIAKRFATGKKIKVKAVYKPKKAQKAGVKKAKGKVKITVKK